MALDLKAIRERAKEIAASKSGRATWLALIIAFAIIVAAGIITVST